MKVAQLFGLRGPWRCQVCRDMDCLLHRSYDPISLFRASCSWQSECLFGQSFSVALIIQVLRGLPCRGPSLLFCTSGTQRGPAGWGLLCRQVHQSLKGAPWVGSYSEVPFIRHLVDQPLYCSAADAGLWDERGYGDGSTPYA